MSPMATLTVEDVKAIRETHNQVFNLEKKFIELDTKITTIFEGNGGEGLLQKAENNRKRIWRIELIIAGLLGSGGIGYGIIQLIGG